MSAPVLMKVDVAIDLPWSCESSCLNCRAEEFACGCVRCEKHGWTEALDVHQTPGFCAGSVYVTDLACGCQIVDDCSYLEA